MTEIHYTLRRHARGHYELLKDGRHVIDFDNVPGRDGNEAEAYFAVLVGYVLAMKLQVEPDWLFHCVTGQPYNLLSLHCWHHHA